MPGAPSSPRPPPGSAQRLPPPRGLEPGVRFPGTEGAAQAGGVQTCGATATAPGRSRTDRLRTTRSFEKENRRSALPPSSPQPHPDSRRGPETRLPAPGGTEAAAFTRRQGRRPREMTARSLRNRNRWPTVPEVGPRHPPRLGARGRCARSEPSSRREANTHRPAASSGLLPAALRPPPPGTATARAGEHTGSFSTGPRVSFSEKHPELRELLRVPSEA